MFFYVKSREKTQSSIKNKLLSGFFLSLAGMAHPAYFIFFPIYLILEIHKYFFTKRKSASLFSSASLFLPFALITLSLELPYFLSHAYFAVIRKEPVS